MKSGSGPGQMAAWNRELDKLLWSDRTRTRPRWWGRDEPTVRVRARMRWLSERTGRPLEWVVVDPYEGERREPI